MLPGRIMVVKRLTACPSLEDAGPWPGGAQLPASIDLLRIAYQVGSSRHCPWPSRPTRDTSQPGSRTEPDLYEAGKPKSPVASGPEKSRQPAHRIRIRFSMIALYVVKRAFNKIVLDYSWRIMTIIRTAAYLMDVKHSHKQYWRYGPCDRKSARPPTATAAPPTSFPGPVPAALLSCPSFTSFRIQSALLARHKS